MVVGLDCHPEEVHRDLIVLESGEVAAQRSPLCRYQAQLTDTENENAALPAPIYLSNLLAKSTVYFRRIENIPEYFNVPSQR